VFQIEASTTIDRSTEDVFQFVSDLERMPDWATELQETKNLPEGPMGVGTTFTHVIKLLGRRVETDAEIIEYEEGKKLAWKGDAGPGKATLELSVESAQDGTRATGRGEVETGGLFGLADPIVKRVFQKQWETNLANLKELLEAGADSQ
jgi:uncharacterized membrane protein